MMRERDEQGTGRRRRHRPYLAALLLSLPPIALAVGAGPARAGITVHVEPPAFAVAGSEVPLRLRFFEEDGSLAVEPVRFLLSVSGSASFGDEAIEGSLRGAGGGPFVSGESARGRFEIPLRVPVPETIDLLVTPAPRVELDRVLRVVFADGVEEGPRWESRRLSGTGGRWRRTEVAGGDASGREGLLGWWSGPLARESATVLVSPPVRLFRGPSLLVFHQRYDVEDPACLADGMARDGLRVELLSEDGTWRPLEPEGGYPFVLEGECAGELQGARVFSGSSGGAFERVAIPIENFEGETRVRFRAAGGCDGCPRAGGWYIDDVTILSSPPNLRVLPPDEDGDGDGLAAMDEDVLGTDPHRKDTDADALHDGVEDGGGIFEGPQRTGSHPLYPDSDEGGVGDGLEVSFGTDPNVPEDDPRAVSLDVELGLGDLRALLRGDGTLGESPDDRLTSAFRGAGGFVLDGGDDFGRFPSLVEALRAGDRDEFFLGPVTRDGIEVTRRIIVFRETGVVRYLDSFRNLSSQAERITISIAQEFFHGEFVEVADTSNGDDVWERDDDHVHFDDRDPRDGMPVFLWSYSAPGARLEPLGVGRRAPFLAGPGALVTFELDLPPGERRSLLHLATFRRDLERSRADRDLLAGDSVLAGLATEDEVAVVNFALDLDRDGMPGQFEVAHGLDPSDPSDGPLDLDGDGLANAEEARHGTNPLLADSDGDGLSDGDEVAAGTDPLLGDSDGDGLTDLDDPHPRADLVATFGRASYAVAGSSGTLDLRVLAEGEVFDQPVVFRVLAEGDAAGPGIEFLEGGEILAGRGTSDALVRVAGSARVGLAASGAGTVTLEVLDTEGEGVRMADFVSLDFEGDNGDFTTDTPAVWEWGEPEFVGAASGKRVWATVLAGPYPSDARATLSSPVFSLRAAGESELRFDHFLFIEDGFDTASLLIETEDGVTELRLFERGTVDLDRPFESPDDFFRYVPLQEDLSEFQGEAVRFHFSLESDGSVAFLGWYLDDFRLTGVETRGVLEFLVPDGDEDRDGVTNALEVERGTDPFSEDTDRDGLEDPRETGTGVFAWAGDTGTDPVNPDSDGGGEEDGSEVGGGRDPNDPLDDVVVLSELSVPIEDGAGRPWLAAGLGALLFESDGARLELGFLVADGFFFFPDESLLTHGGRLITARRPDGFGIDFSVERKVFISDGGPWIRWLELFSSGTAPGEPRTVELTGRLLSSGPIEVLRTASGDAVIGGDDTHFIVRFGGESPLYLGRVVAGTDGPTLPSGLELSSFAAPPEGRGAAEEISFDTTFPRGRQVGFLHFAVLSEDLEEVEQWVDRLSSPRTEHLEGLELEDIAAIANFTIDGDGDGMPDALEIESGLDPAVSDGDADADGDGLTNRRELEQGTDPRKTDTDGDGLSDREEVDAGTSPLVADTDGDGFADPVDRHPLVAIRSRQRARMLAVAGEAARVAFRLEVREARAGAAAGIDLDAAEMRISFDRDVEVVRIVRGTRVSGDAMGSARVVRAEGGWIALDVRFDRAEDVVVRAEEMTGVGIFPGRSTVVFVERDADTDLDGLPDGFEVVHGTDPFLADTERDGIADRFETGSGVAAPGIEAGTFPWTRDSDAGGLDDPTELDRRLDPFDAADDLEPTALPLPLEASGTRWLVLSSGALSEERSSPRFLDNVAVLRLDGRPLPAVRTAFASRAGRVESVEIGPVDLGSLRVRRRLSGSSDRLRFVEEIENAGRDAAPIDLELLFDLASGPGTRILGRAGEDGQEGGWVAAGLPGRPVVHVVFGPRSVERAELEVPDLLRELFRFEVPAGERRTLVHFLLTGSRVGELTARADRMLERPEAFLEDLEERFLRESVNLSPPSPVIWERLPRRPVFPGETWSLVGELLPGDLEVAADGERLDVLARLRDRLVLEAPATPGSRALRAVSAALGELTVLDALEVAPPSGTFRRGDVDFDGAVRLADAVSVLGRLFRGKEIPCDDAADLDDSGALETADAVLLLEVLFRGRGPIVYPGGAARGVDPTPDDLECEG